MIGQNIREYEIVSELGSGGYGMVYLARDTSINREVAVKVVLPQHAKQPEFIANFATEAQLVAQLEHLHIVPLYAYWQDDKGAFLVMRYIRGGSLRGVITKQGALPLNKALRLAEQIADALHTAHERGVIHRDLKPDNILIDERGNAYLTDFGIAKQTNADNASHTDAIKGTFGYLSPEQIYQTRVTPQTDVYAFGVMLYEMLAGKHPFHGTPPAMMVMRHIQDPLPNICDERDDINPAINAVLQKATAKDMEARYASTLDLIADLQQALSGNTAAVSLPAQPTPKKHFSTPEARNRHAMLQNVRSFWVTGVLENSLHDAAMIDLGMKPESGAVDNLWDTLLRTPSGDERLTGESILSIFDRMNGKLLILGAPGGGKTTTLLTLARDLLTRAEHDEQHPLPVVFNLSSWSEQQPPLEKWLIEELTSKYQVPHRIGAEWVKNDALLLLLDGLDEVAEEGREACVRAINEYRAEHGFVDIVVCSRITDYEALSTQLKLNGAVVIQPLDDGQILAYLDNLASVNVNAATIRDVVMRDAQLRELATSPLMLSIMVMAYRSKSTSEIPHFENVEAQRQHLFDLYVRRMFERRTGEKLYTPEETRHYLTWLAQNMQEQAQTVFYIEGLQPDWLPENQRPLHRRTVRWAIALGYGMFAGAVFFMIASTVGILGIPACLVSLLHAIPMGSIGWILASNTIFTTRGLALIGLAFAVSAGATFGIPLGIESGIVIAIAFFIAGFLQHRFASYLLRKLGNRPEKIVPAEKLQLSFDLKNTNRAVLDWIFGALVAYFGFAIILDFQNITPLVAIFTFMMMLLFFVPGSYLLNNLKVSEIQRRQNPNEGIRSSWINGLRLGFANANQFFIPLAINALLIETAVIPYLAAFVTVPFFSMWFLYGGYATVQHVILRLMLSRNGAQPFNYARFLDYAASLILLRKVGGGYIFIHRYLLEYFAERKN